MKLCYWYIIIEIICKEPGGQEAKKAPTVMLLDSQEEFKAFGSKALDVYYTGDDGFMFCNYGESGYLLVEKYKMALNSADIQAYTTPATNGQI